MPSTVANLLKEYSTTLEERRRKKAERWATESAPKTTRFLTADEAKQQYNFDLPSPDYLLKVNPDRTSSYITPSNYEVSATHIITPEGKSYTHADYNVMLDWRKTQYEALDVNPPTTPNYEVPFTKGDIDYTSQYIDKYNQAIQDERQQVKDIFGNVFPDSDVQQVLQFADSNPEGFLEELRAHGQNENTVALLKRMYGGVIKKDGTPFDDNDIAQILNPSPEQPQGGGGATSWDTPLDFSDIKTGIPNYDTFRERYYESKGWTDYIDISGMDIDKPEYQFDLKVRGIQLNPELITNARQYEAEATKAYQEQIGQGNYARSGISKVTSFILPATGKLIDPEQPDINPTDIMFDVATVIPGLGYLSKAGKLIKNAVLATKLVKIANATSMALFTVAQGTNLAENYERMSPAERAIAIGMTGLTAVGAGFEGKALLPDIKAGAKAIVKGGKEVGKIAEAGIKLPVTGLTQSIPVSGLGKSPKIKVLPTPEETTILKSVQEKASKFGLDVEAFEGLSPKEYWIGITRNSKPASSDLRWEWLKSVTTKDMPTKQANELAALTSKTIGDQKAFYPFKTIQDAQKFIDTGDTSLITKNLSFKAEPWTKKHIAETQKAIAKQEANFVKRTQPIKDELATLQSKMDKLKADNPNVYLSDFGDVGKTPLAKKYGKLVGEKRSLEQQLFDASLKPENKVKKPLSPQVEPVVIKVPVTQGVKEPLPAPKVETLTVMSEETYLATHGAPFMEGADFGMHKNIQEGIAKQQNIKRISQNMADNNAKREVLRQEYKAKVDSGEIRPPSRNERLIAAANGNPDNESVLAARRLLEKKGIDWKSTAIPEQGVKPEIPITEPKPAGEANQTTSVENKGIIPPEKPPTTTGEPLALKAGEKPLGLPEGITKPTSEPIILGDKTDLHYQLKDLNARVKYDIQNVAGTVKGVATPEARLIRLANHDAEMVINKSDRLIEKLAKGEQVTDAEIQALNQKLLDVKASWTSKLQDTTDLYKDRLRSKEDLTKYIQGKKEVLTEYVQKSLPVDLRGKLITDIRDIVDEKGLNDALTKIEQIQEADSIQTLRTDIFKQLDKSETGQYHGIPKGKYTAEIQRELNGIDKFLTDNKNEVLKSLDSEQLQKVLTRIKELRIEGRSQHLIGEALRQEELTNIRRNIVDDLTGGKGLQQGVESTGKQVKQFGKVAGGFEKLVNRQYSWNDLMDKLSKYAKGTKPQESGISWYGRVVPRANDVENTARTATLNTVQDNFKTIFKLENGKAVQNKLREISTKKVELPIRKNSDGVEVKFNDLTKGQIIQKYHEMNDPTLVNTFDKGMKWTPEIKQDFINSLTTEEKAWADWIQGKFYVDYYDTINDVFAPINFVDLPKHDFYTHITRVNDAGIEYNLLDPGDITKYVSTAPGALKSRVENIHPLKFTDSTQVLIEHIVQFEHYKAWAETMRDLRSVFGSGEVRSAMLQYHGADITKLIDNYLNDFARGGLDKANTIKILDGLRANFSRAVIGIKPAIALQQVPTVFGYLTELKYKDFITGVADFWKHPVENYKFMMNESPYIKARYTQGGMERDIAMANRQDILTKLSGQTHIKDQSYFLMTIGDKFGVLQGWWATYKTALRKGLTKFEAMEEANMLTDRTQNSVSIDTLSSLQRGNSWWKLATMFQNQPNKYFRIISNNMRNLQYGRADKGKAIKAIILTWVVLPALYQTINAGFQLRKDNILPVVMGPVNDLLVAGQMAQTIGDWIMGNNFDYQPTPALAGMRDIQTSIQKVLSFISKSQDPYRDITSDDVAGLVEQIAKAAGEIGGVPTPYLIQLEKAIRKGTPMGVLFSEYSLKPVTPDNVTQSQNVVGKLGEQTDLATWEKSSSFAVDKIPPVHDTKQLYGDLKTIFAKNLPRDLTVKNGFNSTVEAFGKSRLIEDTVETYPNMKLHEIIDKMEKNFDLNYTFTQYYQDYQTFLGLKKPSEIKQWVQDHPRYAWGNVTPEQYKLLMQYEQADAAGRKQLLKDNPILKVNPYTEWLKSHPEENAQLANFGQVKIYSAEAYSKAQALAKALDIPTNALPNYGLPTDATTRSDYFKYHDLIDKYDSNDPEVLLMLLKNDKLRTFENHSEIKVPEPALQIQIKNRDLNDKFEALTSTQQKDAFKLKNPTWVDDQERVKVYEKQYVFDNTVADPKMVEAVLKYKEDETVNEHKLYRYDNPAFDMWGQKVYGWKPLDIKSVDALKLRIENKPLTDKLNDIVSPNEKVLFKQQNPDYVKKEYMINAYDKGADKGMAAKYAEYMMKPDSNQKKLDLLEDTEFYKYATTRLGVPVPEVKSIPALKLTIKNEALTEQYNKILEPVRQTQFLETHREFKSDRFRISAYNDGVPDNYIEPYVTFNNLPTAGFDRERWLKANQNYYLDVYIGTLGKTKVNFDKVPTVQFEKLYAVYSKLRTTYARNRLKKVYPWFKLEGIKLGKWADTSGKRKGRDTKNDKLLLSTLAKVK